MIFQCEWLFSQTANLVIQEKIQWFLMQIHGQCPNINL